MISIKKSLSVKLHNAIRSSLSETSYPASIQIDAQRIAWRKLISAFSQWKGKQIIDF